jgi:hypothetical protein
MFRKIVAVVSFVGGVIVGARDFTTYPNGARPAL